MAGMLTHFPQMEVAHMNSQTRLGRKLSVTFFTTKHCLLLFMINLHHTNMLALLSRHLYALYLNMIFQLVRVSKSLITLGAGELWRTM